MHVADKKVLVLGAARSGLAAAEFLKKKGAEVTLADAKSLAQLGEPVKKLASMGVQLALDGNYPDPTDYHFLVVSPGVPLTVPTVEKAYRSYVPVISEVELAFRYAEAPIVAITGTNGKTTTTSLVGQIFKDAGINTLVAGNIGLPLVSAIEDYDEDDIVVAEVSSFQLETIQTFRPKVAAILNITPDHLDRHGSVENYIQAKSRIFGNQMPFDYTVLNYDDANTAALAKQTMGRVIFFSRKHILDQGVYIQNGDIVVTMDGTTTKILPVEKLNIPGGHNLENALAAVACTFPLGVDAEKLAATLSTFKGVPHRLETVATVNGVRYVNDSKATNPDAAIKALEAFEQPIVLIAGGLNKGSSFDEFAKRIKEKVRVLILLGKDGVQIKEAAEALGYQNIIEVQNYQEAVCAAYQIAKPNEVVLLSPACASWDMFKSYEERGDLFRELVLKLRG